MESQYKQNITNSVSGLIQSLNSIEKLSLDNVYDKQLIESFENIKAVIFKGVSNIKFNLETLSKVVEWDKLNVSFFGETNAGKSTIIEALINGDGRSIGEGYKDFTKSINIISHENINLMDMPGIEGREYKVIKNIHQAVNKSHVVFYVVGTNKEPEEQTISKIKKFLKDNVKVYSIINVRGKPTAYRYKKELKDKNTNIVEERVKNKFIELLGGNYSGNIVVNGYLALLKSNRLKNSRFENDQIKAFEIFGDKSRIEEFSNIKNVHLAIDSLGKDVNNEIIISNTYKFLKSFGIILSQILREKKNFDSFIKETNNLTEKYLYDVDKIISKYQSEIQVNLDVNINRMRVEIKKTVNQGIDNSESESSIKSKLECVKRKQSETLNKGIKDLLSSMKDEIEYKIKEFKDRMSLQMQFLNFKGDFNLESILESLEVNFKYVLGQIVDIGFSIWGVVVAFAINPILGIVAGVLALARKIWDWFFGDPDKRKREAKSRAVNKVDSMINDIENQIKLDLERELVKINKNTKKPALQLYESMRGIKNISLSIDDKISQIKKSQASLSLILMKKLLGTSVIFSYLDLQLSEAVVVGYGVNTSVKTHLLKIFRLKNLNLYSSYNNWLEEAGTKNGIASFEAKNEFNFRALSALSLHDSNWFQFKRVTRRESK